MTLLTRMRSKHSRKELNALAEEKKKLEQEEVKEEVKAEAKEESNEASESTAEISKEEQLQKELDEANSRYLRLMAEFDNYRKRTQKEKLSTYKDAEGETIKKLLPLLDNFERALEAPCNDAEYLKGVQMIYDSMMETLKSMGLTEYGEVGEEFNAELHNAVMHIDDDSFGKNVVSQVLQKGYKLGDKVVRFAMVQTAN